MIDPSGSAPGRTSAPPRAGLAVWLLGLAVFAVGLGSAIAIHWPALTHYGVFKEDLVQSPHWAAYHGDGFRADDLVRTYAAFNESPLQNGLYWVGTLFLDVVPLSKLYAVVAHGLLSLLFFVVGRAMHGTRFGLLLALFITLLPDHWEYSAGFFSKFWMTPLLLIAVYLLHAGRTRGLIGLLPFAALAYPVSAVLVGMTCTVAWLQELSHRSGKAATLFRHLAIGSALAVALLAVKYVPPPEEIGTMRPGSELRTMPELYDDGYPSHYLPVPPVNEDLVEHVEHPFVLLATAFYFLVLGRNVGWHRGWTALLIASVAGYVLADLFFMQFYVPNRYTRHSLALLVALWNARNWDLILGRIPGKAGRWTAVGGLLLVGGLLYGATFEPWRGSTDRSETLPVAMFIRERVPDGALIAGSPKALDAVTIQARRSILAPYKLAHPWFTTYYDEIRERTRATLRAHFAADVGPINWLHKRYGATHFLAERRLFERLRRRWRVYAEPYNRWVYGQLIPRGQFVLEGRSVPALWRDDDYILVELPLPGDAGERLRRRRPPWPRR